MLYELRRGLVSGDLTAGSEALLLTASLELEPGASVPFRVVRAVAPRSEEAAVMLADARALFDVSTRELEREEAELLARAPRLGLDRDRELVYRGALAIARQSMLPAEGRTKHNYYFFSREPTWSWGHDGQVFHESLSMLAYAHLDPASAMDSQRVFMEAQDEDGYIPYRIGPYVVRRFPVEGEKTTSAPFYSWTNWVENNQILLDRDLKRLWHGLPNSQTTYPLLCDSHPYFHDNPDDRRTHSSAQQYQNPLL